MKNLNVEKLIKFMLFAYSIYMFFKGIRLIYMGWSNKYDGIFYIILFSFLDQLLIIDYKIAQKKKK